MPTPTDTSVPAAAPADADPGADPSHDVSPPRHRRRWAVLRVLLATLALGWCTQYAMRRHFAVGPYTGPVYKFEARVDANGFEDYWNGLMDDTGRIIVPAREDRPFLYGPYLFVEEQGESWVWSGKSLKRPKRYDYTVTQILDMDGKLVWENRMPYLVMDFLRHARFLSLDYRRVGDDQLLWFHNDWIQTSGDTYGVSTRSAKAASRLPERLARVSGETLVEGDSMEEISPTLLAMYNEWKAVRLVGQLESGGPWRTLFEAGERWTEGAYMPSFGERDGAVEILIVDRPGVVARTVEESNSDILLELDLRDLDYVDDDEMGSVFGDEDDENDDEDVAESESELEPSVADIAPPAKPAIDPANVQLGLLGLTKRWQPPTSPWIGCGLIANAPGSRAGDPPVVLAEGEVDGAWLMLPNSENRLVRQGGKWGLQSAAGAWLVPPTWDGVAQEDEFLRVVVGGLCGIVDADGRELIPPRYASVSVEFSLEDLVLFRVRSGGRAGPIKSLWDARAGDCTWLDDQGEPVEALPMGIMAAGGDWVIPPALQTIEVASKGYRPWILAHDSATDTERLYHADGTPVLPDAWAHIHLLDGGLIVAETPEAAAGCEMVERRKAGNVRRLGWDRQVTMGPGRQVFRADGEPAALPACESFSVVDDVGILVRNAGRLGLLDLERQPILATVYTRLDITPDRQHIIVGVPPAGTASDIPVGELIFNNRYPKPTSYFYNGREESDDIQNALYDHLRVYDLASRSWLPKPLYAYKEGFAVAEPGNGWGILQPDLQTVLDWRALGLPAPLDAISSARWTACYEGTIGENVGVFRADGRIMVPFIFPGVSSEDARFIRVWTGTVLALMDRSGRLIVPGGETTWAALGAPGFVPGQRGSPAAAISAEAEAAPAEAAE